MTEKFLTLASAALFSVAQLAVTHSCPIPHHALAVGLTRDAFAKGELCSHTAKRVYLGACRALVEDVIHCPGSPRTFTLQNNWK